MPFKIPLHASSNPQSLWSKSATISSTHISVLHPVLSQAYHKTSVCVTFLRGTHSVPLTNYSPRCVNISERPSHTLIGLFGRKDLLSPLTEQWCSGWGALSSLWCGHELPTLLHWRHWTEMTPSPHPLPESLALVSLRPSFPNRETVWVPLTPTRKHEFSLSQNSRSHRIQRRQARHTILENAISSSC